MKPFIKKAQELTEVRNKVAHTGKIPENAGPIYYNLVLVSDLLYLLDVLSGHEWAKSLVSYELRKALDWPYPTYDRITVTMTINHYRQKATELSHAVDPQLVSDFSCRFKPEVFAKLIGKPTAGN